MALNPVMVIGGIALVGWLASMAAGPPAEAEAEAEADEQPPGEQPPTVDPDFFKDFEPQPIPKVGEKEVITLPAGSPTSRLKSGAIDITIN